MSLSSLKKSTQSDKPRLVTVDQFIDEAVAYAHGSSGKYQSRQKFQVVTGNAKVRPEKMKRGTYTVTSEVADGLTALSERTGIPKSRLIRILIMKHMRSGNDADLLDADIR